jgi:hypothetical protein
MPPNETLTITRVLELVDAAVTICEKMEQKYREVNSDATASGESLRAIGARLQATENQFGWQWRNVRRILAEAVDPKLLVTQQRQAGILCAIASELTRFNVDVLYPLKPESWADAIRELRARRPRKTRPARI